MNVTPEMIEAGAKSMYGHGDEGKWADCPNKDFWRGYAEEALTAALSSPIGRDIRNAALETLEEVRDFLRFDREIDDASKEADLMAYIQIKVDASIAALKANGNQPESVAAQGIPHENTAIGNQRDIRNSALEEAAMVAYRVCAETRHVTLGDKAAAAIRALKAEGESR